MLMSFEVWDWFLNILFQMLSWVFPIRDFFSSSKDIFAVFDSLNGVPFWVFRESFAFEIIQLILTLHREQLYFGWGVKLLDCFGQNLTLFCQRSVTFTDYESGFPLKILRNFNICDFKACKRFVLLSQSQKILNSKDWYLTYKWKSSLKIFRWIPKEELFNFTVHSVIYILCKTLFVII